MCCTSSVTLRFAGVGRKPNFEFVIVKDADHGFNGYESELGALMADWLKPMFGGRE